MSRISVRRCQPPPSASRRCWPSTQRLAAAFAATVDLEELADGDAVQDHLVALTGSRSVPKVYIGGELVGGTAISPTARPLPALPGFTFSLFISFDSLVFFHKMLSSTKNKLAGWVCVAGCDDTMALFSKQPGPLDFFIQCLCHLTGTE